MSTTQDNRNGTRNLARLAGAIIFVLTAGMGYTVSPQVEGAVNPPISAEDQDTVGPAYLPSDCVVDGLVFSECNLDF